jgi:ATP-dependent helicase/DNAse subunit B
LAEQKPTSHATILLGPAAAGKTQRLVELLVGQPGQIRPRWAVLPDRTQVSTFRRRIAAAGGALGVSVGTFGDLFQEILARAGRPVAVTPEPARQRLLRLALRQLEAEGKLPFYQPIARTPGFLEVVGEAIAELKRGRVAPEAVAKLARALADRGAALAEMGAISASTEMAAISPLTEMAAIYAEFERRLAAIPWTDREGLNELAIRALGERPGLLADMPLIAVDGFDSFEAAQLEALAALSGQVERLVVALPGTPAMSRSAHRRFARALEGLRRSLPGAAVEALGSTGEGADRAGEEPGPALTNPRGPQARPRPPAPLQLLEASLFEREAESFDPEGVIELLEARGPTDEAREALRWIKARILRDEVAREECALIAPEAGRYGPALRRAAAEFGIQLHFAHGDALLQAPAISALLDLLELTRSGWPRRLTLQAIRSPYFDLATFGFGPGDALALDAASHAGQVVEGLDQWEATLARLAQAEPDPAAETLDEGLPVFAAPKGAAAGRLLEALQALARRLDPARTRTTSGWVGWLEDLLDELRFPERAAEPGGGEREQPAFEQLRETLRSLVMGEIVSADQPLSYGEFLDELYGAIETASYRQRRSAGPAVSVLGPLEARGGRYRAVVVMGLSEGLFPAVEREDPFLDEATRSALGLEPRLGREQPGLFYQAVTRADAHLLLTRPYLADDGEAWQASPFWEAVAGLLTTPPRRVRPEDPRALQEAGSPQELLFWGVRRGGMPASLLEPHRQRWAELQHSRDVLAARSRAEPGGPHEGDLAAIAEALALRFGRDHLWSPSRLETYGSCPHMFYASHLLGLEVRQPPEPGLDAAQLGSVLHEILEAAYRSAADPTEVESVLQAMSEVCDPILDRAPQRHGFRPTPLWAIERAQYLEALRETVRTLAEQGENWTPIGLELKFGIGEQPALQLVLDGGTVRVRGIVDRLDRRPDGGLRVIDYKTGRSRLNPGELDQGRRIQLPLYAMAAQEALGLGRVVDGFYWAILAAERGTLRLANYRAPEQPGAETEGGSASPDTAIRAAGSGTDSDRPTQAAEPQIGPAAAYAVARGHVDRIVKGVSSGAFAPVPPPGGCPEYCPAAAWCWRYQPAGWG